MKPSGKPRTPSALSDALHHRLNAYALAASAAGVGMLALAKPADAKIIYTPAHKHITLGHPVSLELNRLGVVNFTLSVRHETGSYIYRTSVAAAYGGPGNSVAGHRTTAGYFWAASALRAGRKIGPNLYFVPTTGIPPSLVNVNVEFKSRCFGSWDNVTNRYLGFEFRVGRGPTQYGWARLNVSCSPGSTEKISGLLTGYAYESIPNRPIIAGRTKGPDVITAAPASLGALARGSSK
jgi:hypothetical protein